MLTFGAFACALGCESTSLDAVPPSMPDATPALEPALATFALDSIDFGEATRWQSLGFDLDGKQTTASSSDVCTRQFGAPPSDQVDGLDGRDNAFAANVLPLLESVVDQPDLSSFETSLIRAGAFTLQIQTMQSGVDPGATLTNLGLQTFTSGAFSADGGAPPFDLTTDWPVQPASVVDGKTVASSALAQFREAYIVRGILVAGASESVTLPLFLEIDGVPLVLSVHSALVSFDLTSPTAAVGGIIAGVLDPTELLAQLRTFAALTSPVFCVAGGLAQQVEQFSDILLDRTNHAGVPCNGISIGIGFHATRISNPSQVGTPPVFQDPCDAGP